jgi:hypothetical protein
LRGCGPRSAPLSARPAARPPGDRLTAAVQGRGRLRCAGIGARRRRRAAGGRAALAARERARHSAALRPPQARPCAPLRAPAGAAGARPCGPCCRAPRGHRGRWAVAGTCGTTSGCSAPRGTRLRAGTWHLARSAAPRASRASTPCSPSARRCDKDEIVWSC